MTSLNPMALKTLISAAWTARGPVSTATANAVTEAQVMRLRVFVLISPPSKRSRAWFATRYGTAGPDRAAGSAAGEREVIPLRERGGCAAPPIAAQSAFTAI